MVPSAHVSACTMRTPTPDKKTVPGCHIKGTRGPKYATIEKADAQETTSSLVVGEMEDFGLSGRSLLRARYDGKARALGRSASVKLCLPHETRV